MPHLYVSVRMNGVVADQRLCAVRDEVWLGEEEGALVSFPGPSVLVRRLGGRLQANGRWLEPGTPLRLRRGDVDVSLESILNRASIPSWNRSVPDLRVLVASAAVVLLGAWWETVEAFVEAHPQAIAALMDFQAPAAEAPSWASSAQGEPDAAASASASATLRTRSERALGDQLPLSDSAPRVLPVVFLPKGPSAVVPASGLRESGEALWARQLSMQDPSIPSP